MDGSHVRIEPEMSGTGTAVRKAVVAKRKVASTDIIIMMPQTFADEPIVSYGRVKRNV